MIFPLVALLQTSTLDQALEDPKLSGAIVSCTVADESGGVLYQRNSDLRVMPASNEKLLTNSFALFTFGPDYRPTTKIWKRRDRIIVDSSGNPMLSHSDLVTAADRLHLHGKRPVYVHEAYRPLVGPSWEWDDLPNKYAAPVCAFTVDRGSFELWCRKGQLILEPRNYGIAAVRGLRSGPIKVNYDPARRSLSVDGALPKEDKRLDTLAVGIPDAAAAEYLGRSMILVDSVPNVAPDLTIPGPPMKSIMTECLVHSDNNIAENLLLMSAARAGSLGKDPYAAADGALTTYLVKTVGVQQDDCLPQDGSGMSRHDLVTTRALVKVLQWSLGQPTRDVWLSALATPGKGTLEDRLKNVPFVGKTGTLDKVVALSGYVHTSRNRTLIVSLVLNHFACKTSEARDIVDNFIKLLVADTGFGTKPANMEAHEARFAHPCSGPLDVRGTRGPHLDGRAPRERADRRVESADAGLHQPE